MDRTEALAAIRARVQNENLIKHMLATEAIMRTLARRFHQDEDEWGITGLIHDVDVELTQKEPQNHSKPGADLAREMGASESMCHVVLCHNEAHGVPCETLLDKALFCTDPLTGLITAGALIRQEKSLAGLSLDEFLILGLDAMKGIATELRL